MLSWKILNITQSPGEHLPRNGSALMCVRCIRMRDGAPTGNRCSGLPMREEWEGGQEERREGNRSGREHNRQERNRYSKDKKRRDREGERRMRQKRKQKESETVETENRIEGE